ncbi:hypothetical protein ScPMuIL_017377 [Solemya velum]
MSPPGAGGTLFGTMIGGNDLDVSSLIHPKSSGYRPDRSVRYTFESSARSILGDDFTFIDEFRTSETTLEDILAHRTGLMSGDLAFLAGYESSTVTKEDLIKRFRYLPAPGQFRDEFKYNNIMYMLAGLVAEHLGNATWEDLMTEKLLVPLGMDSTTFTADVDEVTMALPYIYSYDEKDLQVLIWKYSDMLKWMEFLLERGWVNGKELLDNRSLMTMMNGHISLGEWHYAGQQTIPFSRASKWDISYGFGWFLGSYRGYRHVHHGGSYYGQTSGLKMFPDIKTGVYVTTNGPFPEMELLAIDFIQTNVADILLRESRWLNETVLCFSELSLPTSDEMLSDIESDLKVVPPAHSNEYTGSFGNYLFGNVHISNLGMKNQLNLSLVCTQAEIFTPSELEEVDELVKTAMECQSIPGLSLAVYKQGEKLVRSYGLADMSTGREVEDDTVFCIASVTKSFSTMLLAILLEDEDVNTHGYRFESSLRSILGNEFKLIDEFRTSETTLEDILAHRTGLMSADLALFAGYQLTVSREDLMKRFQYLPAPGQFRDEFKYSNIMYMLAGLVAEHLGNATWEDLIKEKLFVPLGMNGATFTTDVDEVTMALPYLYNPASSQIEVFDMQTFRNSLNVIAPAGSICLTSPDMLKWMEFLLYQGSAGGRQIVDRKSLLNMMNGHVSLGEFHYANQRQKPLSAASKWEISYGLGWFLGSYRGYRKVYHDGSYYGQSSSLQMFPDIQTGVYVATNGPFPIMEARATDYILTNVVDTLLREKRWFNETQPCLSNTTIPSEDEILSKVLSEMKTKPEEELNAYTGSYGNYLFGDVHISSESSQNQLNFTFGLYLTGVLLLDNKQCQVHLAGQFATYARPIGGLCEFADRENHGTFNTFSIIDGQDKYIFHRNVSFNEFKTTEIHMNGFELKPSPLVYVLFNNFHHVDSNKHMSTVIATILYFSIYKCVMNSVNLDSRVYIFLAIHICSVKVDNACSTQKLELG